MPFSGIALMAEGRALGLPAWANRLPVINGKHCCGWCDPWLGDCCDTRHGFCPVLQCMTSPHYVCSKYEED